MQQYERGAPAFDDMNAAQRAAADYAWSHGILDAFVLNHQIPLWSIICHHVGLKTQYPLPPEYQAILQRVSSKKPLVLEIARRFGKTSLVFLAMIALAIQNKKRTYYFCAPSEGGAREIVDDIVPALLDTCPPKRRPNRKKMVFEFPNGSRIKIGGTFNGGESLRGRASNGNAVDEAGAIQPYDATSCLSYVLSSVLQPMLMTTRGWSIILTTPPANMQHDYYTIAAEAEKDGRKIRMDIYQNTGFTPEEIEEERANSFGLDPTGGAWSREYLCRPKVDAKQLIIDELAQNALQPNIRKYERPPYFEYLHRYIAMDHGTVDLNAILFGYWDFPHAKLIVEKELSIPRGPTTKQIAKELANARMEVWNTLPVEKCVCDSISQQVRTDLNAEFSDLYFMAPQKSVLLSDNGEREGMVNKLRMAIADGQIIIDPSCTLLLETINTGTWKVSAAGRREFARLNQIGHCDMLAALMYLWQALLRNVNPLAGKNAPNPETHWVTKQPQQQGAAAVLERALNKGRARSIFDLLRNR